MNLTRLWSLSVTSLTLATSAFAQDQWVNTMSFVSGESSDSFVSRWSETYGTGTSSGSYYFDASPSSSSPSHFTWKRSDGPEYSSLGKEKEIDLDRSTLQTLKSETEHSLKQFFTQYHNMSQGLYLAVIKDKITTFGKHFDTIGAHELNTVWFSVALELIGNRFEGSNTDKIVDQLNQAIRHLPADKKADTLPSALAWRQILLVSREIRTLGLARADAEKYRLLSQQFSNFLESPQSELADPNRSLLQNLITLGTKEWSELATTCAIPDQTGIRSLVSRTLIADQVGRAYCPNNSHFKDVPKNDASEAFAQTPEDRFYRRPLVGYVSNLSTLHALARVSLSLALMSNNPGLIHSTKTWVSQLELALRTPLDSTVTENQMAPLSSMYQLLPFLMHLSDAAIANQTRLSNFSDLLGQTNRTIDQLVGRTELKGSHVEGWKTNLTREQTLLLLTSAKKLPATEKNLILQIKLLDSLGDLQEKNRVLRTCKQFVKDSHTWCSYELQYSTLNTLFKMATGKLPGGALSQEHFEAFFKNFYENVGSNQDPTVTFETLFYPNVILNWFYPAKYKGNWGLTYQFIKNVRMYQRSIKYFRNNCLQETTKDDLCDRIKNRNSETLKLTKEVLNNYQRRTSALAMINAQAVLNQIPSDETQLTTDLKIWKSSFEALRDELNHELKIADIKEIWTGFGGPIVEQLKELK